MSEQLFVFSRTEWDVLFNEPHELWKLYGALRLRMDRQTGIAGGEKNRINETAIYEVLRVDPIPGRNKKPEKITRQRCRSAVQRLIGLGLLEPKPGIGPLVFRLPMAVLDKSALNRNNRGTTIEQPAEQPNKTESKHSGYEIGATRGESEEGLRNNLPQDKGKDTTISTARARKTRIPDDFPLTDDMRRYATDKGAPDGGWLDDWHETFIDRCRAKGYEYADFKATWRTWLRNDLKSAPAGPEKPIGRGVTSTQEVNAHAKHSRDNGRRLSAVDRAIAAERRGDEAERQRAASKSDAPALDEDDADIRPPMVVVNGRSNGR